MYVGYDSTTPDLIPLNAQVIFPYIDGDYRWTSAQLDRFPHAHRYFLTVYGDTRADGCDVENGDMSIDDALSWFKLAERQEIWRPIFYGATDTWEQLTGRLDSKGIARSDYRQFVADPTGEPHLYPGSDITQWYWGKGEHNYDESLMVDSAIKTVTPPPSRLVSVITAIMGKYADGRTSTLYTHDLPLG